LASILPLYIVLLKQIAFFYIETFLLIETYVSIIIFRYFKNYIIMKGKKGVRAAIIAEEGISAGTGISPECRNSS